MSCLLGALLSQRYKVLVLCPMSIIVGSFGALSALITGEPQASFRDAIHCALGLELSYMLCLMLRVQMGIR